MGSGFGTHDQRRAKEQREALGGERRQVDGEV
jgi:hypothetical protein